MGAVDKRGRGRYRARYWSPDGRQRSKTFSSEREAKDWLASRTVDVRRGDWTDPKLAQVTLGEWGTGWLHRKAARLKPSTVADYRSLWTCCFLPDWGNVPLGAISHLDVDPWVARMSQRVGASRTRKAHGLLAQMLDAGMKDGRLSKNPARGVDLPRLPAHREHRYLTHQQVQTLADTVGEYRPFVLCLAYTGLRFGEAAALKLRNVDLLRGRIRVASSVSEINGLMVWGTPKTHQARSVPVQVPPRRPHRPDDRPWPRRPRVPVTRRHPLRNGNWRRRVWNPTMQRLGLDLTPHDLRHTAASLAVDPGANVKAVQRMLGHASAAMTLDLYTDLFDGTLDAVADRLDAAYRASSVSSVCPGVSSTVVWMQPGGQ